MIARRSRTGPTDGWTIIIRIEKKKKKKGSHVRVWSCTDGRTRRMTCKGVGDDHSFSRHLASPLHSSAPITRTTRGRHLPCRLISCSKQQRLLGTAVWFLVRSRYSLCRLFSTVRGLRRRRLRMFVIVAASELVGGKYSQVLAAQYNRRQAAAAGATALASRRRTSSTAK